MKACPYCGYGNPAKALFCDNCAKALLEDGGDTSLKGEDPTARHAASAPETMDTNPSGQYFLLFVYVQNVLEPVIAQRVEKRIVLGRMSEGGTQELDGVDLTPYGALEKGVSRLHAAIEPSEGTLALSDLGSTNGTWLNGRPLAPHEPCSLRNGDEIRLGMLVLYCFIQSVND